MVKVLKEKRRPTKSSLTPESMTMTIEDWVNFLSALRMPRAYWLRIYVPVRTAAITN